MSILEQIHSPADIKGRSLSELTELANDIRQELIGTVTQTLPGQTPPPGTAGNAFIRKYNIDGAELWTRQFGSTYSTATGIASDGQGNHAIGSSERDVALACVALVALPGPGMRGVALRSVRICVCARRRSASVRRHAR